MSISDISNGFGFLWWSWYVPLWHEHHGRWYAEDGGSKDEQLSFECSPITGFLVAPGTDHV